MTRILLTCTLSLILAGLPAAAQKKITGSITYVTSDGVYTDLGTNQGIRNGDTLSLEIKERFRPALIVRAVSRRSSMAVLMDTTLRVSVGQKVTALIVQAVEAAPKDTSAAGDTSRAAVDFRSLWAGAATRGAVSAYGDTSTTGWSRRNPVTSDVNRLRGRIGLQYFVSRDRNNPDYDFQQPGAVINMNLIRIQGGYFNLNTNIHVRKTYSKRDLRSDNYPVRVYELSLEYRNDQARSAYAVGRVSSPVINGIGYFDGALFEYRWDQHITTGGFAGTEPDYRNSKPQTANSKVGAYLNYLRAFNSATRFNATLAFAGQYVKGKVDREFFYQQSDLSLGPDLYLYQNAEVGLNRSNQSRRSSKVELSNLYLMARYRPHRTLSLSISYDERKNVFLVQTYKSIPDSLFDDALRQGLRGDVSWRATRSLTLSVNSSVRTRAGDPKKTFLHSAGIFYTDLFQTRANLNFRFFYTTTPYTRATSTSTGLSRSFDRLYLTATYRTYRYALSGRSTRYSRQAVGLDASYDMSRRIFVTGSYEYATGQDEKSDRFFMEMSYRF